MTQPDLFAAPRRSAVTEKDLRGQSAPSAAVAAPPSQEDAILAHMQDGNTITPAEAYEMFGCLALHSRIAELRARNYVIECEMVVRGRKRWGKYSMPQHARRA